MESEVENKKVINAKKIEHDGIQFKSLLEGSCYKRLKENNIPFEYEKTTFMLTDKTSYPHYSFKDKKIVVKKIVRPVTYTPDFVYYDEKSNKGWIIETKGWQTDSFKIKFKLFKIYLEQNNLNYIVFLCSNKSEVNKAIEEIKNNF